MSTYRKSGTDRQSGRLAGWHARTHVFTEQFTLFGVSLKVYVSMHSNYGFMNGSTQSVYTVSCEHWIPIHRYKLHTLIKTEAKLILMNTHSTHTPCKCFLLSPVYYVKVARQSNTFFSSSPFHWPATKIIKGMEKRRNKKKRIKEA